MIILIFNYFTSVTYSFNEKLYVKPYLYIPSFVNGLLTGYLLHSDSNIQIPNKYIIILKRFNIFYILIVVILSFQTIFYDELPLLSSIEISVFNTIFSINFCDFLLHMNYVTNRKQTFLMKLSEYCNVSYFLHFMIIHIMTELISAKKLYLYYIPFHYILTFTFNFVFVSKPYF